MEASHGRFRSAPLPLARAGQPPVPSAVLGTLLFVFAEAMFFSGLISAFLVIRSHAGVWPPPGQPRLPLLVTGINTFILLISGFTMWRARRAIGAGRKNDTVQLLGATFILGATFLLIQGYEWVRLIEFGLTTRSNVYGGLFYVLIGTHGLHVLGALAVLGWVLFKALSGRYSANQYLGLSAMSVFWYFVVAVWPVLYSLVYLW